MNGSFPMAKVSFAHDRLAATFSADHRRLPSAIALSGVSTKRGQDHC
jgi:hypothetical protein